MKKILISLIFILNITPNLFSQIKGGEAVYKVIYKEDTILKKTLNPRIKEKYENATNSISTLKLHLVFCDTLSIFCKNLENFNAINSNFALSLIDCQKIIYTNSKNKTETFNSPEKKGIFKKNEFLVTSEIDGNWDITNESKTIADFKCLKATKKISLKNEAGIFYRTITAWYCPEIPFPFGPKHSFGLPGLVFELQDRNVTFGLESIIFFDKKPKINFPNIGVRITYEEYEKILKERTLERMHLSESKN